MVNLTVKNDTIHIKKHNALTDGYIPDTGNGVLADKILNILYWKYIELGEEFTIAISELRKLLSLKSKKDDLRILKAIETLQKPMQLRNFTYEGKGVAWMSAPFLSKAFIWENSKKMINFKLDEMVIDALQQKGGYTPLDISISNQFKTKYGLKLYEMYMRYYNLPNKEGKGIGTIAKSLDELNAMMGTKYKHKSEILRGIHRGLNEIYKTTNELVSCFYNDKKQKFIFSWEQKSRYPKLRIPFNRVDELIDWYISKNKNLKIKSVPRYRQTLKTHIINDEFDELDSYYRGMLRYKYDISPNDYIKDGHYLDFKAEIK